MNEELHHDPSRTSASNASETPETTSPSGPPRSFRDQPIYQLAFEFQARVYEVTKHFPEEELYALTEPLRRSARSIGAAIAEAWTKRRIQGRYPQKLSDVESHAAAADHWLGTAAQCGYLAPELNTELHAMVETIRGHVWRMTPRPGHGRPNRNFPHPQDRPPRLNGEEPPRRDETANDKGRPRRPFRNHEGGRFHKNPRSNFYTPPAADELPADDFTDSEPNY